MNWFKQKNPWNCLDIVIGSKIIVLWIVFGILNGYFKILTNGLSLPIFYFLIWFSGLFFEYRKAFWISFIGHFLFDFCFYLHPLSFLIWCVSGFLSMFLSLWKNKKTFWPFFAFLVPLFYLLVFLMIAQITFISESFLMSIVKYFVANIFLFVIVLIINPLFSIVIFYLFKYQKALINFQQYGSSQINKND